MVQLLCHLWGDYILQSDWMAQNKTKAFLPAWLHASAYTFCFLFLRPSILAIAVIMVTHFLIDRFRLARYLVWAKNWMGPRGTKGQKVVGSDVVLYDWTWSECAKTGYPPNTSDWMAVWLLIIADNTLHLTINFLALKYL